MPGFWNRAHRDTQVTALEFRLRRGDVIMVCKTE
jgi:hypothetical protein